MVRRAFYFLVAVAQALAIGYLAALLGLAVMEVVAPQRGGPLAIIQILSELLYVPAPLAALAAILPSRKVMRGMVLVTTAVLMAANIPRFLPLGQIAHAGTTSAVDAPRLSVMSWNVLQENTKTDLLVGALSSGAAGVIGIQELSPVQSDAIESDPLLARRYPFRILLPRLDFRGIALLSAYPIVQSGESEHPPIIWTRLDVGGGRQLFVVVAHPLPSRVSFVHAGRFGFPVDYDPSDRDLQIAQVRSVVDPILGRNEPVMLLGDFNVTVGEPGYRELTSGLIDAQRTVGYGTGATWKSWFFMNTSLSLLRIDYLLSSPRVVPVQIAVDCQPLGSDHCQVRGRYEMLP